MVKLEHIIFCRRCRLYMELGAFNWQKGYFEGPYIYQTTERVDSDLALRQFLEAHGRHNVGFASDIAIDEIIGTGFGELSPTDAYCMAFVSRGKTGIYNFEKFSKRFETVLFIVDVYGWAWDIASKELLRFLPNTKGTVVDLADFRKMEFQPEEWDMVLVYPWFHKDVMERLEPRNTIVCVAGGKQLEMRREFNLNCGRFWVYGANNKAILKVLQKRYSKKKIALLSHGVDTEKFKPNLVPHDKFTVGWVGATTRESKRFPLCKQIVHEIGAKLKVASRENYIPHEKMPEFYNSVDVLLITSEYEAHPLIAYEAMSSGLPVVSTNVGDLSETIENGETGFIFDPCAEKKMLPEALKLLRDDPKLRKNMGEEARRTILQKWKWENISNQYKALGKTTSATDYVPKVSVITAVKNRADTIRRCVDSVLREEYPNLEYIIVDGASDDGTPEILREYEKRHDFITAISEPDKSQGEARNKGLKIASGDFVTFLDSDDEMIDGKLGVLSEFLLNSDKHFAAFGNTVFRTPKGKVTANNRLAVPDEINFETLSKGRYNIGSGAIMLRNSPEVSFDEDKRFGEDYTLWNKLVAKYPFAYLDFDAYYWTQGSPDGIGKNTENWQEIMRQNREEIESNYAVSPHSRKMKVAVFCDPYGMHPFGGPAIYGYNIVEMLYRSRLEFIMFYNPVPSWGSHPDYYRREEHLQPRPDKIDIDEFDVFYVMNSPRAILELNRQGVMPIIGSNHITNSAADHCLQFLNEEELISRGHRVGHERAFLRNYKGKFWFAQSKFQIGEYQRVGMNLDETDVYLAPNPTDTNLFKRRTDFGESIIWSGKNNWAKGVQFLEKVCHEIPEKFICLWAGEGKEFPLMPSNCAMTMGNTLFHIPRYLEQGRVFLSTSVTENQPCAVLEAMSMELPVVGFHTSGMPEVVEDGETGFLVELGDVGAMMGKVNLLLEDESLRREMGQKAREFVVESFSYHATLDRYLNYFKTYLED